MQLIPQNSYNCPYTEMIKITLKFLDQIVIRITSKIYSFVVIVCFQSHFPVLRKFIKISPQKGDRQTAET